MEIINHQKPKRRKLYWIIMCMFMLGVGATHLYYKLKDNKDAIVPTTAFSSIRSASISITDSRGGAEQKLVCNNSEIIVNIEETDKESLKVIKKVVISDINGLESNAPNAPMDLSCLDISINDAVVIQTSSDIGGDVQKEARLLETQKSSNTDKAPEDVLSKSNSKASYDCEKHEASSSDSSANKEDCSCDKESSIK